MMMTSCSLTQKKNLPLRVKLKVTTTNLRANLMMRPTQRTALSILLHLKQAKQTRRIKLRVKFPRESGLMNLMEKEVKPRKIPKARKLKTLNLVSVAIKIEQMTIKPKNFSEIHILKKSQLMIQHHSLKITITTRLQTLLKQPKLEFWRRRCSVKRTALNFLIRPTIATVSTSLQMSYPLGSLKTNKSIIGNVIKQLKMKLLKKNKRSKIITLVQARKLRKQRIERRNVWSRLCKKSDQRLRLLLIKT